MRTRDQIFFARFAREPHLRAHAKQSLQASLHATQMPVLNRTMNAFLSLTATQKNAATEFTGNVIYGASVITEGPALGHGFSVDRTAIEQICALLKAAEPAGVRMRLKHPDPMEDDVDAVVGMLRSPSIDTSGDAWHVRADCHLADYAAVMPGRGDVRGYLVSRAATDPASFGLSVVMNFDAEVAVDETGSPVAIVARPYTIIAVDFVGAPAANPGGLF